MIRGPQHNQPWAGLRTLSPGGFIIQSSQSNRSPGLMSHARHRQPPGRRAYRRLRSLEVRQYSCLAALADHPARGRRRERYGSATRDAAEACLACWSDEGIYGNHRRHFLAESVPRAFEHKRRAKRFRLTVGRIQRPIAPTLPRCHNAVPHGPSVAGVLPRQGAGARRRRRLQRYVPARIRAACRGAG